MEKENKKLSALSIVGIVLIAIFLPIIIINLTIVIKSWVNPDKIPMVFNRAPLIVVSDSMTIEKNKSGKTISGAFNKNDLIIVKKVQDPTNLQVGDIITFIYHDGSWVTHRITAVHEDGTYETKGDYSPGYDPYPVKPEQIQGIYAGVRFAGLGKVALFFQTVPGIIVLLVIPLAVIGVLYFVENSKKSKETQSKNAELEAELAKLKAGQNSEEAQPTEEQPVVENTEEVEEPQESKEE